MSRPGTPLDNAPMESFFGVLKNEVFYPRRFDCVSDLEQSIQAYLHYYNTERVSSRLKTSPVKYRKAYFEEVHMT